MVGKVHRKVAVDVGTHMLADLCNIEPGVLRDQEFLRSLVREGLMKNDFTILTEAVHSFGPPGFGVTGFFLLSESHAAFHSYPEFGYLAIDVFSCGVASPQEVISFLSERLGATRDHCWTIPRSALLEKCKSR